MRRLCTESSCPYPGRAARPAMFRVMTRITSQATGRPSLGALASHRPMRANEMATITRAQRATGKPAA
jgi:hypothetical protein